MSLSNKTYRAAIAAVALALPGLYACGLADSIQSTKMMAATVLATPEYDLAKAILPTGDASIPDGGFAIPDGGAGDGGFFTTKVPAQTIAQVFFGQRQSDPSQKPTGLAGAAITLAFGGKTFTLKEKGEGNYLLSSLDDNTLKYLPDTDYEYTVKLKGETFTAKVKAPAKESIEQFKATGGAPLIQKAQSPLQLTRSAVENIAFTTVLPLSSSGAGDPTYTDAPSKALDLIDLIANDSRWKQKVITIPGTAFPAADSKYLVNVTAVKKGTTSDNLFLGSAFVAGVADLQLVQTPK